MALSDAQQADLYSKVVDLYGSQFNPHASESMFATPGEGAIWNNEELARNDDGMIHPMFVAWAAQYGDPGSIQALEAIAADTGNATAAAIATAILADLKAAPAKAAAPARHRRLSSPVAVNKKQVSGSFHTVVTLLSGGLAAGTWALHNFGGALSPDWATGISSGLVALGALVNFLTEEDSTKGKS